MPTSVDIKNLKINKLTEAQYDTAVQGGVIGENELSVLTDVELEQIQVSTLPTANADELGKIYQYIGATDSTYTNAYFYKCVSDGLNPATYSWEQVDVMPAGSSLPSQTGNAGKFLITNGTSASWGNEATSFKAKTQSSQYYVELKTSGLFNNIGSLVFSNGSTIYEYLFDSTGFKANFLYGTDINLGSSSVKWTRIYVNKINNGNDINVPTVAGSMSVQVSSMPTADSSFEGQIYQFTGTTDSTYTNGRFYKCVSDGQTTPTYSWEEVSMGGGSGLPSQTGQSGKFLTTDGTDASWATINALQNTATGSNSLTVLGTASSTNENSINIGTGSSVSSQGAYDKKATVIGVNSTGDQDSVAIGYGTTGNLYSVVIGCSASAYNNNVIIGYNASGTTNLITCIGKGASCSGLAATAIGQSSHANAQEAIQIGSGTNSTANTLSIGLDSNNNYRLLNSDGTIPTDRFTTTPVADGSYVPTLTISNGTATRTWGTAPSAPVVPSTMPTLAVADWSSNTQTVSVTGVTASNIVIVSPAPASATDYAAAGIVCTAQGAGTLTFTCTTVPSNAITVNVIIM